MTGQKTYTNVNLLGFNLEMKGLKELFKSKETVQYKTKLFLCLQQQKRKIGPDSFI